MKTSEESHSGVSSRSLSNAQLVDTLREGVKSLSWGVKKLTKRAKLAGDGNAKLAAQMSRFCKANATLTASIDTVSGTTTVVSNVIENWLPPPSPLQLEKLVFQNAIDTNWILRRENFKMEDGCTERKEIANDL